ncbi:Rrf2 family transcriptional regulator [Paracoccus stylophorae]|uniref:Rrf2 family transcriptional regulator n=1 Tax=Paracoccus stylophorae TaxID=659350 RepID=A0ABY7SZ32_9RHOB|nr:Rrf2 family transcriptional regulator [Paracoccus stylophorae]WCR12094.1 Rrf2 family transcriptional regulator [Paracoccus stylophorae]
MRLTSFTDYGLRILMRLAAQSGQVLSTAELASDLHLSRNHLSKIVQHLSRHGIVVTQRGGGGGAALALPADQVRLGDVVRLLEDGQPLVECFAAGGGECSLDGCCRLKSRLRHAEARFLDDLNRSTMADIALKKTEMA